MSSKTAIVDYGLGNLFSLEQACQQVGLDVVVSSDPNEVAQARAVILPGVGSFGAAMQQLEERNLGPAISDVVKREIPLVGICLGMQLLMNESTEFGQHKGLGFIPGRVVPLVAEDEKKIRVKIPHVGWNEVKRCGDNDTHWNSSPLSTGVDAEQFYFVHSYVVEPADPAIVLTKSSYGCNEFCSSFLQGRILGCQFHPERSGRKGLALFEKIAEWMGSSEAS